MVKFLSPEWIAAFDDALREHDQPLDAVGDLIIQHIVVDNDDVEVTSYAVTVSSDGSGVTTGHHRDPTVTYTQTLPCAVSVASGQRSAHDAVMVGDLTITGDVTALIESAGLLDWLDRALAPLRASTEFDAVNG